MDLDQGMSVKSISSAPHVHRTFIATFESYSEMLCINLSYKRGQNYSLFDLYITQMKA